MMIDDGVDDDFDDLDDLNRFAIDLLSSQTAQ
jgi:hypothetical protein